MHMDHPGELWYSTYIKMFIKAVDKPQNIVAYNRFFFVGSLNERSYYYEYDSES